ncbi:MAG: PTS system mannose/fructose/sorbose family transporter subunit IID [Moritella sp.]|nr:PTS system mannose/fructose/sorbose family transporter subunit IID [Moritella sp.]
MNSNTLDAEIYDPTTNNDINDHVSATAEGYRDKTANKVITKRDLWHIGFRGLLMEGNFNYERMQAGGFCYSIIPALKKIHKDPLDLSKALKNNLNFYNAHPKLFTFPLGLCIAMEENKENPSTISSVKAATMGPTGGIGDAIDHMTMMPLTLGIGAAISLQGSIAGPFVFFVLYQSYHFFTYFWLLFFGYNSGVAALEQLSEQAEKLGRSANILGLGVLGAMTASFVRISTPLVVTAGEAQVSLQTDMLDKIMPNLLPLAFVGIMFYFVQKGKSPSMLIFSTLAIGICGRLVGIL